VYKERRNDLTIMHCKPQRVSHSKKEHIQNIPPSHKYDICIMLYRCILFRAKAVKRTMSYCLLGCFQDD